MHLAELDTQEPAYMFSPRLFKMIREGDVLPKNWCLRVFFPAFFCSNSQNLSCNIAKAVAGKLEFTGIKNENLSREGDLPHKKLVAEDFFLLE